ncbi:phosphate regulon transcriptional regulator PhoB [Pleionea sp. CnH1-48]|uniref:phosphate regulon transcriptional regulator PhoB n=1 Tax=Pleionea sp. CnH1-48 TaxID=2954494 RepID=UPI00209775C1|nr:phosphate regulon transcriptional regulator PhoB [Pleionea sp. CnH1-48]MCO7226753.1 phosphate regulon transcriptional regulator PhoB [Pleionea sp. CnH1-48]
MNATIMVVEDERDIREMLVFSLEQAGYSTLQAGTSEKAMSLLQEETIPDLLLVDWMLPGASGVELTRKVKKSSLFKDVPVIMLTARGEEDDRIKGLDAGADDYVIKPFSPRELMARIRAVLRRTDPGTAEEKSIEMGRLKLDTASYRVTVDGQTVKLGPTEYKLLLYFLEHPERVFTRSQLLDAVWGHQVIVEERTVDVHIRRLRKALDPYGIENYVQTVRGAGYRFSHRV